MPSSPASRNSDSKDYPKSLPVKQAAAAVGQSRLMWAYEKAFERLGVKVAQIFLTHQDLADRRRFLNARHTLTALIGFGVMPIINENDTVAVDEIRVGDNDTLAAEVAHLSMRTCSSFCPMSTDCIRKIHEKIPRPH